MVFVLRIHLLYLLLSSITYISLLGLAALFLWRVETRKVFFHPGDKPAVALLLNACAFSSWKHPSRWTSNTQGAVLSTGNSTCVFFFVFFFFFLFKGKISLSLSCLETVSQESFFSLSLSFIALFFKLHQFWLIRFQIEFEFSKFCSHWLHCIIMLKR